MLWFCGGLALFLLGMHWLEQGVGAAQGQRLSLALRQATASPWRGLAAGFCVTLLLQSSSAVTLLTVGLVNAGLLRFRQAAGVLLGANIGTTITGHLVRLTCMEGGFLLRLLSGQWLAPLLLMGASLLLSLGQGRKANAVGTFLAGLGILFTGLLIMGSCSGDLTNRGWFQPLLCKSLGSGPTAFASGFLVALVVDSSSAAVGILQTLAQGWGRFTFDQIWPALLGISIGGALTTTLLGSLRSTREGRLTARFFLLINLLGSAIGGIVLLTLRALGTMLWLWGQTMDAGAIANLHTALRLGSGILLMGCLPALCRLTEGRKKLARCQ